ncbi:MAG TPA: SDR family NAD(P)-dependent oxidoreductase [Anaerolineales bacterium]|nr:SDR family NAD(P)-dependent oxidoreductase [Anaerolineales bacterium]
MSMTGKTVLITGAGKGAGRVLAEYLATQGARVAANDILPVNLDDLVRDHPGQIAAYPEDMAKKVGVQAVIKQVEDDFGRIDILINHAAVEPRVPLLEMDEWDWHRVLDVNLTGAFLAMQSAGRIMKQQGSGVIINLINLGSNGQTYPAAYAASMYGLIALTRAASAELAGFGVAVHAAGRGIGRYQEADRALPADLRSVVLVLCEGARSGQIVNVEEL